MDISNEPILGVQGYINLSDTNSSNSDKVDSVVYYKRGTHTFPLCRVTKNYVVGGIFDGVINNEIDFSQDGQTKKYCVWNSTKLVEISDITDNKIGNDLVTTNIVAKSLESVINYYNFVAIAESDRSPSQKQLIVDMEADSSKKLKDSLAAIDGIVNLVPGRTIAFKSALEGSNGKVYEITSKGSDWKQEFTKPDSERGIGTILGDLMQQSIGFVGPMVTLYVTLLEFSDLHTTSVAAGE